MHRVGVYDLARLVVSLDQHGKHERLVDYLALPRIDLQSSQNGFVERCKDYMLERIPFDELPQLGFAPQDRSIFKKRFDLLSTNNRAYMLAVKENPTVRELTEFASIEPCWALLFPVKLFLVHHPERASRYRGFVPFGSEVKKFYNEVYKDRQDFDIDGSPSFKDHVRLMELTNKIADQYGMTSVAVNNEMYLEGLKMVSTR